MKKLAILACGVLAACALMLTACGDEPNVETPTTVPTTKGHTHAFGEWVTVKEATCTEKGEQERVCACGEKEMQSIDMVAHTEVTDEAVAPTCTKTGLTGGKHCSVCNEVLTIQQEVPIIPHTYDDKYDENCNTCGFVRDAECAHLETEEINGKEATCTTAGLTDGTKCKKCGEILVTQSLIPEKGHTKVTDKALAPTCTATGLTEGEHCSVCNEVLTAQEVVKANGHTEVTDEAVAPTCTETGLTEGRHCSVCNEVLTKQEEIKANGHSEMIDQAVTPTCTTAGLTEGKHCSICHEVLTKQEIVEKSHTWSAEYQGDKNAHWLSCDKCDENGDKIAHDVGADGYCNTCDMPIKGTEGVLYDLSADGAYAVVIDYMGTSTRVNIADEYQGRPVTEIYQKAFEGKNIICVIIPDSVTIISDYAFYYCLNLSKVTIGNGINTIGVDAFCGCNNIQYVEYGNCQYLGNSSNPYVALITVVNKKFSTYTIHDDTKVIAPSAFYGCTRMVDATIPNAVTNIGNATFYGCSSLTSVTIPNCVTTIGDFAFYNCSSLTSLFIPDSVNTMGELVFYGCTRLESIRLPFLGRSATSNGKLCDVFGYTFLSVPSSLKIVVLSNTCNSIAKEAFYGCNSLTNVTIGNGITAIGEHAFYNCSSLTSVVIPDSVTTIGELVFYGCTSLESVTLPFLGENATSNGTLHYFFGANLDSVPLSLKTVVLTETCTAIGSSAFACCKGLISVTIPDSVITIGSSAFAYCSSLISVSIPESVTTIGYYAFEYCIGLTSIDISDGVTTIESYAFRYCSSLTEVVIPDTVTTIGSHTFESCSSLTSATIGNGVTYIGQYIFRYCSNLVSVIIDNGVTNIGSDAFYYCSNLTEIHFNGTREQWKTIGKDYHWDYYTGDYIVYCTDGNLNRYGY